MNDPSTYWLTFTNAALGIVVLICCAAVAVGVIQEIVAKRKKASAMSNLDREVNDLVNAYQDGHAFHLPELGMTMADGGQVSGSKDTAKEK